MRLGAEGFPKGYDTSRWWKAWNYRVSLCAIGDGLALDNVGAQQYRDLPTPETSAEDADKKSDALNQDAFENRRYSIPHCAKVQVGCGPIQYVFMHDGGRVVWATLQLTNGTAIAAFIDLDTKNFRLDLFGKQYDTDSPEYNDRRAGIRLVLSYIIRNFLVPVVRERIIGERHERTTKKIGDVNVAGKMEKPVKQTRIVYIPRILWVGNRVQTTLPGDIKIPDMCITRHHVSAHLRRLQPGDKPSIESQLMAFRYRIRITDGYTFLRPHERNAGVDPKDQQSIITAVQLREADFV